MFIWMAFSIYYTISSPSPLDDSKFTKIELEKTAKPTLQKSILIPKSISFTLFTKGFIKIL